LKEKETFSGQLRITVGNYEGGGKKGLSGWGKRGPLLESWKYRLAQTGKNGWERRCEVGQRKNQGRVTKEVGKLEGGASREREQNNQR